MGTIVDTSKYIILKMAACTVLKICSRSKLSQLQFSTTLFKRTAPVVSNTSLVSKRDIQSQRVYGPAVGEQPSYVKHWLESKYMSGALLLTVPLAVAVPHPILDTLAAQCGPAYTLGIDGYYKGLLPQRDTVAHDAYQTSHACVIGFGFWWLMLHQLF